MKIEEAIKWMEEAIRGTEEDFDQCSPALQEELTKQKEVFELAINALRSMPEAGGPLTLEQLQKMDRFSPPIYDDFLHEWCCVREDACAGSIGVLYIGGGTRPLQTERFYARSLVHIDRGKWISIENHLPKEKDGRVLVFYPDDFREKVKVAQYSEYSDVWYIGDMCAVSPTKPTHWMPLPEPPEVKDHG